MRRAGWQRRPYPVWLGLVVTALFVSPNLAVMFAGPTASAGAGDRSSVGVLAVTLMLQLTLFAIAILPLVLTGRLDGRLFGTSRARLTPRAAVTGVATGVVAVIGSYGLNAALVLLLDAREPVEQQLLRDAASGGSTLLLVVVVAVVVAPFTEEVVFRGVLFRSLSDRLGSSAGIVISAAIFALVHVEVLMSQPVALAGLFVIGAILAWAYSRTGNLVVAIVGHATFNTVSLSLAAVLGTG